MSGGQVRLQDGQLAAAARSPGRGVRCGSGRLSADCPLYGCADVLHRGALCPLLRNACKRQVGIPEASFAKKSEINDGCSKIIADRKKTTKAIEFHQRKIK